MYNIKQITAKSLPSGYTTETKTIHKHGTEETTAEYYVFDSSALGDDKIMKLGYCVNDPRGINYPIFLRINGNGNETEFQIGKTGMFEFQPENYKDVNAETIEEETAIVYVDKVCVPAEGINFCLDYCYTV